MMSHGTTMQLIEQTVYLLQSHEKHWQSMALWFIHNSLYPYPYPYPYPYLYLHIHNNVRHIHVISYCAVIVTLLLYVFISISFIMSACLSPPPVEAFSVSKTFDTLIRTFVRVSKMNVVARAQLEFQMLTLLNKNIYTTRGSIKKHGTANVWPSIIAQMVRAFDMNPMFVGSSPPRVETFSVSKTLTFSLTRTFVRVQCFWKAVARSPNATHKCSGRPRTPP